MRYPLSPHMQAIVECLSQSWVEVPFHGDFLLRDFHWSFLGDSVEWHGHLTLLENIPVLHPVLITLARSNGEYVCEVYDCKLLCEIFVLRLEMT